jgi:hypothetical protein
VGAAFLTGLAVAAAFARRTHWLSGCRRLSILSVVEPSRLPRAYLIFLLVDLLQLGLLVLLVGHTRVVPAAAAIQALLLWRLARGGPIAWMLLLAENLVESLALLAVIGNGTEVMWGNVAVLVIPSLIMVSLLVSAPMRRHVGLARTAAH